MNGGEGGDVFELWTRVVLLEVVARPEVLGWRWSMTTRTEEEGGVVNLLVHHRWPVARAFSPAWTTTRAAHRWLAMASRADEWRRKREQSSGATELVGDG
jgi:hypothetical protein